MAMLPYDRFYRRHGVRRVQQLPSPPVSIYSELVLPRNSVFHWFGYEHSEKVGLDQSDQIAKGVDRFIFAENIEQYQQEDVKGNPRNLPLITTTMTRRYFAENRKIRRLKMPIGDLRDDKSLVVYNYGLLNDKYKYTGSMTTELDRWLNYHRTVYNTIGRLTKETNRHHFVEIDVPIVVPPLTALLAAEEGLDMALLRRLDSADDWQVSEFFNLITTGYKAYIFKDIVDDKEALAKINVIFRSGNEFTVLNLGRLFSFTEELGGADDEGPRLRVAKRYLKAMMYLRQNMTLGGDGSMQLAAGEIRKPLADELDNITRERDSTDGYEEDDDERYLSKRVNAPLTEEVEEEVSEKFDPFNPNKRVKSSIPDKNTKAKTIEALDEEEVKDDETQTDEDIDKDLAELETLDFREFDSGAYEEYKAPSKEPKARIERRAKEFAEVGLMTPAEVNRVKKIAEKVDSIPDPRGSNKTLKQSVVIEPEELVVDEGVELVSDKVVGVTDKSMLHSTLNKFDKEYINKTLDKDVANMTLSLQKAGIMVLDYKVERVTDIVNDYEIHRVKVQPVGGKESTISFKLPKVSEEGTFRVGGTTSRMRKQRSSLPIVKVAPDEVSLTSYYSKLFVTRTPRKQFNYTLWIGNEAVAASIDDTNTRITDVKLNNVFDPSVVVPSTYSGIAMRVSSMKVDGIQFYFDVNKIKEKFGVEYKSGDKLIPVGIGKKGIIHLDHDGVAWQDGKPAGLLEELFGFDVNKRPIEFVEVKLFSKAVPLVLLLGYEIGLGNLIKTLGATVKRLPPRQHYTLEWYEYAIVFKDEKLILDRREQLPTLVLSGLRRFGNTLKTHSVYELDKTNVYNTLMDAIKVPLRYLKEIPLMFDMWVDHITEEILIEMKEPTDLFGLFIRSCEMLLDDTHPDVNDTAFMRDRGYERFSGMVFSEMVTALRKYNNKPVNKNTTFELHPEAVWYSVLQDESVIISEQSNPIHQCKEQEIVVYRGAGGRSALSMTAKDRRFHNNSLGVTSEATVDNGDVGTVLYTTFNPNYKNVRGMSDRTNLEEEIKPSEITSTSMMLSPGAENDDAKRTGFISIQNSATTFCEKYSPLPVRTGAERVIGSRTGPMFSVNAKGDCTVKKVTKEAITVIYKDGEEASYPLGRHYGIISAKDIPHDIVTDNKEGDKLSVGQSICYNKNYFQPDPLNEKQTIFKTALNGRVALIEGSDGYEDSTAMSNTFASKMGTRITHIRDIVVSKDQGISGLVELGDTVDGDTILCTIHNEQSESTLFDEEALKSLSILGALNPTAKYQGVVERIECLYVPQVETMTESLQEIVGQSDRRIYKMQSALGAPRMSGIVPAGFRIKGTTLSADSVAIRVYITESVGMGVGDKLVVSNQLKATVGRVWNTETVSEDGQPVDVFFSYQSVDNRIVGSPEIIGTTATILIELGKRVIDVYNTKPK